jgi:hypothetical protein
MASERSNFSLADTLKSISLGETAEATRLVEEDRTRRTRHRSTPKILEFPADAYSGLPRDALVPLPGTISLFLAPHGSDFLQNFENALATLDVRELQKLFGLLGAQLADAATRVGSPAQQASTLIASPTILDFGYGRKTLAENISLPAAIQFAPLAFPYNGGPLDLDQFFLDEWFYPGKRSPVDTLVVKANPVLSDVEKSALAAVPASELDANVGKLPVLPFLPTTVYLLGIVTHQAAIAAYAYFNCCGCRVQNHVESRLRQLGSAARLSARELTRLRESALLEDNA